MKPCKCSHDESAHFRQGVNCHVCMCPGFRRPSWLSRMVGRWLLRGDQRMPSGAQAPGGFGMS